MNNEQIHIKLKSFDHKLLDQAARDIINAVKATGADVCGPIPLPTNKEIFTVNRSPHVNKKSREQFEIRTQKRLIKIKFPMSKTIDALMKVDLAAGVEAEMK